MTHQKRQKLLPPNPLPDFYLFFSRVVDGKKEIFTTSEQWATQKRPEKEEILGDKEKDCCCLVSVAAAAATQCQSQQEQELFKGISYRVLQ